MIITPLVSFKTSSRGQTAAFTLVELLAVIAIIGILGALLLVGMGRVRDSAKSAQCSSNLRQLHNLYTLQVQDNRNMTLSDKENGKTITVIARLAGVNYGYSVEGKGIQQALSCPVQLDLKPGVVDTALKNNYPPITFSLNRGLNWTLEGYVASDGRRALSSIPFPTRMILASDGNDSDKAVGYYGGVVGVGRPPETPHNGKANVVYVDGHVGTISDTALLNVAGTPKSGTVQAALWFGE